MRKHLKKWERQIDELLEDRGFTLCSLPSSTVDDRLWAQNELRESGLMTTAYIFRLRAIINTMEYALQSANSRIDALLDIVRHSSINCNHCMNARTIDQKDRCSKIDYDCVICKEVGCPCRNCKDGQNFIWHIVPGHPSPDRGQMQRPIELAPGKYVPLHDMMCMLPIFIEHRYTKDIVGGLYDSQRDMAYFSDTGDDDGGRWLNNTEQGETWRIWLVYPTQKERDAAPWKEVPNREGLTEEELHENGC